MYKFKEDNMNVPCYVWSKQGSIEQGAIDQIKNASSLPFVFNHTALMADAHQGYGVSIGSVVALKDVVCPFMVGVDIGCGMCAVKTSLTDIDTETLKKIMGEIRKQIPLGMNHHKESQDESLMPMIEEGDGSNSTTKKYGWTAGKIITIEYKSALRQIGTLGGGNHFIEIQKGSDGFIWIMIHSGSRNLGKQVADYYNKLAVKLNEKWISSVPKEWELAFLPIDSEEGKSYLREMNYCVDFALANRKLMMERIIDIFQKEFNWSFKTIDFKTIDGVESEFINIAHNYAKMENHFGENVIVHRKGTTLATTDTIGIIPGSMGSKSYIVRGLGNPESFNSCSHGAGRRLGRAAALRELNFDDEVKKMEGIVHGMRNNDDLEESPGAYKSIDEVMENQKDLVEILTELKPLAVIKG